MSQPPPPLPTIGVGIPPPPVVLNRDGQCPKWVWAPQKWIRPPQKGGQPPPKPAQPHPRMVPNKDTSPHPLKTTPPAPKQPPGNPSPTCRAPTGLHSDCGGGTGAFTSRGVPLCGAEGHNVRGASRTPPPPGQDPIWGGGEGYRGAGSWGGLGAPHPLTWGKVGAQRGPGGQLWGRALPGALGGKESLGTEGDTLTPEPPPPAPNLPPNRDRDPQFPLNPLQAPPVLLAPRRTILNAPTNPQTHPEPLNPPPTQPQPPNPTK